VSGDFQVGDVVVCVDDSPARSIDVRGMPWPMRMGSTWRVIGLVRSKSTGEILLLLKNSPPHLAPWKRGWVKDRFRKLPRADVQFARDMRACKPHRVGDPA